MAGDAQTRFEFATATRIVFGNGVIREVGNLVAELGARPLIVTGRSVERCKKLAEALSDKISSPAYFQVIGEPTLQIVEQGVALGRERACDVVIAYGGGSVIDAGKAIAAMLANEGELLDYVEVIGRGRSLKNLSMPFIAIPTTAGTGAEVTRNAVLASPEHRVKVSLRSPLMLPRIALVDPELTYDLPPEITASTGLDALTQVIEPYVSCRANPLTDALCREAIPRVALSLRQAYVDGRDAAARYDMAYASLSGGLALANAGLGAVHGFAAPIGGMFKAPHGAVCAALLPAVMAANIVTLEAREPQSDALRRYDDIARWLTGNASATRHDGVAWVRELCRDLAVKSLRHFGIPADDLYDIGAYASHASSMKGNPIVLTRDELEATLQAAY